MLQDRKRGYERRACGHRRPLRRPPGGSCRDQSGRKPLPFLPANGWTHVAGGSAGLHPGRRVPPEVQAGEETEEERKAHLLGKDGRPRINWGFIGNMRVDTIAGMFSSEVVTWAIIVVAVTLGQ